MLLEAGAAMLVAATAAAAGGLAFSLIRPGLEPLGGVGDVLTGMVCVAAYMLAISAAAPTAFGAPAVGGIVEAVGAAVLCSLLFGPVVGLTWFYAARKRRMK